jgi:hypothetical protein
MPGGVAQVIELLPCKHKALSSNTSTAKKKKKGILAKLQKVYR